MTTEQLTTALSKTVNELNAMLESLSQEQIDTVPFKHSWTAGKLAEHVYKATANTPALLEGNTTPTERAPGEKVNTLKEIFLNYDTKMKSPPFIEPTEDHHPKEVLMSSLQNNFDRIAHATATLDLSLTCLDFELPNMGRLTRLEWCSFVLYHTERHNQQLRKIVAALGVTA